MSQTSGTREDADPDAHATGEGSSLQVVAPSLPLHWRWIFVTALLGVALHWQTLAIGFAGDDYLQLAMLSGTYPGDAGPFELFTFFGNSASELEAHMAFGTAPWWTVEGFHGAVLRPLASALIWLDNRLFGPAPGFHHLHSLLWWAATIIAAGALLRRILPAKVAALALVAFALDDAATLPVAWLANRSVLVASVFSFVAIGAHLRWRTTGSRRALGIEICAWVLAFLAGEYALSGIAFVLAYELVGAAEGGIVSRFRGLLPATGIGFIYLTVHRLAGFGTLGSAVYVDPFEEPIAFLGWAAHRIPRLWGELTVGIPSNLGEFSVRLGFEWAPWLSPSPEIGSKFLAATILATAAAGVMVVPIVLAARSSTRPQRRTVAWLSLGAALGLVPIAAAPAHGRLLLLCNLGTSVLVAWVLVKAVEGLQGPRRSGAAGLALALFSFPLLLPHFVLEPWAVIREDAAFQRSHARIVDTLVPPLAGEQLRGRRVILVAAAEPTTGLHGHLVLRAMGLPLAKSWQVLSMTLRPHIFTRTAENAFELSSVSGPMLQEPPERFFRPERFELTKGDSMQAGKLRATIVSVRGGGPDRVRFELDTPLESLLFLTIDEDGLREIAPPPLGKSIPIRPPRVPGAPRP